MKRLTIIVLGVLAGVLLVTSGAFAQDYLELLRSDLRTLKTAIVTEAMQLSSEDSESFWPVYREYEAALAANYDRRIALIRDYAQNFETMSDPKARELALDAMGIDIARSRLLRKYYYEVERATSSVVAARFVQVERQIGLLIDLQIAAELPLIQKP